MKARKLAAWIVMVIVVLLILMTMQKRGEMRLVANRMIKEEKVGDLIRLTNREILAGKALGRHEYSFESGVVQFASRSEEGVIDLRDRLNSMELSIEPKVSKDGIFWSCRSKRAVILSTIDCDVPKD